jgi:hypothetical protein
MPNESTSIAFPCLVIVGNVLLETTREEFKKFDYRGRTETGNILLSHGATARLMVNGVIEGNGRFRDITVVRRHREWLRGLAWLHDLVLAECEISKGQELTVSQLLEKVAHLKASTPFQTAGHLRGYLRRQPQDRVFDASMFREFWDRHSRKLKPEQWTEQVLL